MPSVLGYEVRKRPKLAPRPPARPLTDKELRERQKRHIEADYLKAHPEKAKLYAERLLGLEDPDPAVVAQQKADAAIKDAEAAASLSEAAYIRGNADIGRELAEARVERLRRGAEGGGQFGQLREALGLIDELQDRGNSGEESTLDKFVKLASSMLPAVMMAFAAKVNPAAASQLAAALQGQGQESSTGAPSPSPGGMASVQPQLAGPTRPALSPPTVPSAAPMPAGPPVIGPPKLTPNGYTAIKREQGITVENLALLPALPATHAAAELWELLWATIESDGPAALGARRTMDALVSPIPDDVLLAMMGAYAESDPVWQPLIAACQTQPEWSSEVRGHLRKMYELAMAPDSSDDRAEEGDAGEVEEAGEKKEDVPPAGTAAQSATPTSEAAASGAPRKRGRPKRSPPAGTSGTPPPAKRVKPVKQPATA